MAKLTLSVDEAVVERAKRYAAREGTSVSRLVETYLDLLVRPEPEAQQPLPPVTRRLVGALGDARDDRESHLRHLERKYR